jgi:hypothetical protein
MKRGNIGNIGNGIFAISYQKCGNIGNIKTVIYGNKINVIFESSQNNGNNGNAMSENSQLDKTNGNNGNLRQQNGNTQNPCYISLFTSLLPLLPFSSQKSRNKNILIIYIGRAWQQRQRGNRPQNTKNRRLKAGAYRGQL